MAAVALILRESDVQDLIEMPDVIAAVENAMRELGEGDAQNEPRRRAFGPGGLLNVMFASYPGGSCSGRCPVSIDRRPRSRGSGSGRVGRTS